MINQSYVFILDSLYIDCVLNQYNCHLLFTFVKMFNSFILLHL